MASGGLCCTARDLARWGQLLLAGGAAAGGRRVLERGWVEGILRGAGAAAERFGWAGTWPFFRSYSRGFWVVGDAGRRAAAGGEGPLPVDGGCFCARGIHGQAVLVVRRTFAFDSTG